MIWGSITIMTLVDPVLLAAGIFVLVLICKNRKIFSISRTTNNFILVAAGVLIIVTFHAADLFSMWVMPSLVGMEAAMSSMEYLHQNISWIANALGIGVTVVGFARTIRSVGGLIGDLQSTERNLAIKVDDLQKIEARYRDLIENSDLAIHITSPKGERLFVNDALCRLLVD